MEECGFFVTLPSNASLDIYPNNKISHYTTKFAKPIDLNGIWEVSLAEVQYIQSWYSLTEEDSICHIIQRDGKRTQNSNFNITPGYYKNIDEVVSEINNNLKKMELGIELFYNRMKNKIRIVSQKHFAFKANGKLAYMLGMNPGVPITAREPEAPNPSDIHAGFYTMYVYTDVIEYQRVGDSFAPLLRCVHITGENNKVVTITYDKLHYVPLTKNHITDIVIEVKTDQNKPIPFSYGKFIAKLHFRPAKHSFRM